MSSNSCAVLIQSGVPRSNLTLSIQRACRFDAITTLDDEWLKHPERFANPFDKKNHPPFCSLRFCTVGQVTLADNNGHLSARFCVMRRKRRRLLDLSMRVSVYNPLTASSYWRMGAVLTELRHDAVIGLPGTQKRFAVDAPPSHKFNGAWGLSWGFRRGAYESKRSAGVLLLFSSRWYRQGQLRRVCCPPLPLSGRCGAAVVKN